MAPIHGKMSVVPLATRPDLKLFRPQSPFVASCGPAASRERDGAC
jgi:hypothetical protein